MTFCDSFTHFPVVSNKSSRFHLFLSLLCFLFDALYCNCISIYCTRRVFLLRTGCTSKCNAAKCVMCLFLSFDFSALSASATSPGLKKSGAASFRKQAGRQGLHVCGRDLPESPAHLRQRPPVAHPGLLRPHRRGVRRALHAHSSLHSSHVIDKWKHVQIPTPASPGCARVSSG